MTCIASALSMPLDGFVTAPDDCREHPLGVDGQRMLRWLGPPMFESVAVAVTP